MKKSVFSKIWTVVSSILITALVIGGSILAYLYANGFRINLTDGKVRKTGVLSVESIPSRATVYVDGQQVGKSPKVIGSLDESIEEVKLTKDGYFDWLKRVPVFSEKSSPISPFLTMKNPPKESVYSNQNEIDKKYINTDLRYFLIVTKDKTDTNIRNIYKYDINRQFWDVTDNPQLITTINEKGLKDITLNISKDGKWTLAKIAIDNGKTTTNKYRLIHLQIPINVVTETELEPFGSEYAITWSNNSSYLVLESKLEILTYRVEDKTKFLLLKKKSNIQYVWTTDSDGFFYYSTPTKEKDDTKYTIYQETIQGSGKKELIKDIYFANTDKFILELRAKGIPEYIPMTNSTENTNFAGEITSFSINQKTNGFYIKTTLATYWYDKGQQKYFLLSPTPCDIVSVSPDSSKILFIDQNNKYFVFVFVKEDVDPITKLGVQPVFEGANIDNILWLQNGNNISYSKDNKIRISDFNGENVYEVMDKSSEYLTDKNDKYLYQIDNITTSGFEIVRYQIN
ncbi:PEGA domain-containing protein [Candidatus Dojkabacteria bacterium]|jgi:hypothetical protein|nr:PEGA domain-containing protein [Candidatus Dojkabacteria bacterium]